MQRIPSWAALVLFCVAALPGLCSAGDGEPKPLELNNEIVCFVNTTAISKKEVEDVMHEFPKLRWERDELVRSNQWTEENEKKWNQEYIPPFRDALRKVVREKLLLQYAKTDKIDADEKEVKRRLNIIVERIKKSGSWIKGYDTQELMGQIREDVIRDTYRQTKIFSMLDQPNRPQVEQYYRENITHFQRNAGAKVRIIRIDRFKTDPVTRKQSLRENAFDDADKLRNDIIAFGGNFAEIAKRHSDDTETRDRGGLILLDPKDPFFDPEGYNAQLAAAIRPLTPGDISTSVSKVFEFGQTSYAIAWLEARRQAGPVPLEEIYDDVYRTLMEVKSHKKEDAWFRKALSQSLVTHVVEAIQKPLTVDFFFPEEKEIKAEPATQTAGPAKN